MQIGTVSGLWFCGRSWRFKIHFRWNIVRFEKSYICSNKLDVQETNLSFTQINRIRNHLFGRWIEIRRDSCSRFVGSDCFCFRKHDSDYRETGATRHHWQESMISREDQRVEQYWLCSLQRPVFASRSFVVCVWGQRSSDQDDFQGKKSDTETCFQDPQSCAWFGIWSNQFGPQNPNQIHRHQKPTPRHIKQVKFHTWWMESSSVFVQHSAISVPAIVLKRCRKEHKQM